MDDDQLQAAVNLLRDALGSGARREPLRVKDLRPVRDHFLVSGEPKRMLAESDAHREAARLGKKAYRCKTCRFWHLGQGQTGN